MPQHPTLHLVLVMLLLLASTAIRAGEVVESHHFEPGVTYTIQRPETFAPDTRIQIALYGLPNGNTTEQTMGRVPGPEDSWRFDIQHIAAQTRYLRETARYENLVTVYLEAETQSWPTWRKQQAESNALIQQLVARILVDVGAEEPGIILTGHSGGGSFILGYINGVEVIPENIERIVFLDSNYGFSVEEGHGEKLLEWLERSERHRLIVMAYDDREIMLNGKKVVSDTGGTYRATRRMLDFLTGRVQLSESAHDLYKRWRALEGQLDFIVYTNPENRILHTVIVGEYNGFIHSMLSGGAEEGSENLLGPRVYMDFADKPGGLAPIPPRHPDLSTGREFIASVAAIGREERETAIGEQLARGNIPEFLRSLVPITYDAVDANGTTHTVVLRVMPDYLAIGSDADWVRMPMNPRTAQVFCDTFGYTMPTRMMVDRIWTASAEKLEPIPLTEEREAPATFLQHHDLIEAARSNPRPGHLVGGIKKDVVLSNRIYEKADRVAIYGWHYTSGKPIQPLTTVHVWWYVDYSHGIRPVWHEIAVDGDIMEFGDLVGHPVLHPLVSDEGPIGKPYYEQ